MQQDHKDTGFKTKISHILLTWQTLILIVSSCCPSNRSGHLWLCIDKDVKVAEQTDRLGSRA